MSRRGPGPAPKPAHMRARRNKDTHQPTVLRFVRGTAPELPDDVDWHPQTREWWAMWQRSPQAEHFMESDWYCLLDTALMHSAMWSRGQWTLAAEVRQRVAKYGATPEDRLRLRMQFADADEKDRKRGGDESTSDRYGDLHVLPGGEAGSA